MASKNDKHLQPSSGERATAKARHSNPFVYFGTLAILVITIIAFVVAPSLGSGAGGGDALSFGSWDNKSIAFAQGSYFAGQVQQVKSQLEAQGYKDSGDQFFAYQVWRRAFENTAIHMALLSYAQDNGIAVSARFLDEQMAKNPAFVENGAFSRRKFREASAAQKASIRGDIRENALKERFVADSVSIIPTEAEKAFIKAMAQEERSIEYVAFPFSSYPDSARADFARANATLFRKVGLSQITVTASAKEAQAIAARVVSGALSFEDAAKNHSKDQYATRSGDMGERFAWELRNEIKDPAKLEQLLALPEGGVSEVFETVSGSWAFYRVNKAAVEADLASQQIIASAGDYIKRYEKGMIEDYALKAAESFIKEAGTDFESAAATRGLSIKSTSPFPINYGGALDLGYFALFKAFNASGLPELAGADRSETFFQTAFSLSPGKVSSAVVLNDNAIVMRVKEIVGADESSLGLIDYYYSSVLQESLSRNLADGIVKSPRLKDNFLDTFLKAFASAN